jgi:PRTRC genetic system protein B
MQSYVNVGWTHEFKLSRALLVYGQSNYNGYPYRHPFVTIHDVVHEQGDARLGPAQLLTPEMLRTLIEEMGQSQAVEILPENVIARTAEVVVWWSPAQVHTMFFSDRGGDKALRRLNGKRYPNPPLLLRASGNHLWIRALRRNERPKPDTKLCMAPYWNCYDNGSVCTGSMRIPQGKSLAVTMDWEQSFFGSAFSHAAGVTKHTRYPDGRLAMWKTLLGKRHFPPQYLVPLKETLEQFVSCDDTLYRNQRQVA